jgi:hypothetical protein
MSDRVRLTRTTIHLFEFSYDTLYKIFVEYSTVKELVRMAMALCFESICGPQAGFFSVQRYRIANHLESWEQYMAREHRHAFQQFIEESTALFTLDLASFGGTEGKVKCWLWMKHHAVRTRCLTFSHGCHITNMTSLRQASGINHIVFNDTDKLTNNATADMVHFVMKCPSLTKVTFPYDKPERFLVSLPETVEVVELKKLTSTAMSTLAEKTPNLTSLASKETDLNPKALATLATHFPRLKWVQLQGILIGTKAHQTSLIKLLSNRGQQLISLDLTPCRSQGAFMDDDVIDAIAMHCPNLQELHVMVRYVSDGSLVRLIGSVRTQLKTVTLNARADGTAEQVSNTPIRLLFNGDCAQLASISLANFLHITDSAFGIPPASGPKTILLSNLTCLYLAGMPQLTNSALRILIHNGCRNLQILRLSYLGCVNDNGVKCLLDAIKGLTTLALGNLKLSNGSIDRFFQFYDGREKRKHLTQLSLSGMRDINNIPIVRNAIHLKFLTKLELQNMPSIGDETLKALGAQCKLLVDVVLERMINITANGVAAIAMGCCHLQSITLRQLPYVGDACIEALALNCKCLRSIVVDNCPEISLLANFEAIVRNSQIRTLKDITIAFCSLNLTSGNGQLPVRSRHHLLAYINDK